MTQQMTQVTTEADLDWVVEHHFPLLHDDQIIEIVDAIPVEFKDDPRAQFLQAVVFYHLQHKEAKEQRPPDWQEAYQRFVGLALGPENAILWFHIHNYRLLAARNAGLKEMISKHFEAATYVVLLVVNEQVVRYQLLGFLLYNWSRHLIKQGDVASALQWWQKAALARIRWYNHVKSGTQTVDAEIISAATEVGKLRSDFPSFFPDKPLEECGVKAELFEEVGNLANRAFTVAKQG